jgi:hypothetical protein
MKASDINVSGYIEANKNPPKFKIEDDVVFKFHDGSESQDVKILEITHDIPSIYVLVDMENKERLWTDLTYINKSSEIYGISMGKVYYLYLVETDEGVRTHVRQADLRYASWWDNVINFFTSKE